VERLTREKGKKNVEVFNLGTGNGFSVMEVIKSFERTSGVKLNYEIKERRPGDIVKVWADTEFANSELGWKADKSLDEMTRSAWKWEQALAKKKL
jgi:UDP-glucose 4-epimerase